MALHSPPGGPTEEKYGEVRWISPADERLRYTLAGSWYDYSLSTNVFLNGGALVYGLTLPDGRPVNPLRLASVSEDANNVGVSASIQYDINDSTTLSLEGRYQVDDICGTDQEQGLEHCKETKALLPRVAISSAFSNNHTAYAQAAIGNNPGGVNIAYTNPNNVEALLVASGQIPSPNDGIIYDGSDGVHFPAVAFDADAFNDFEEEKLYSFEIGSKGNFAEGRGSYTAAVYYLKFENSINVSTIAWDDDTPNGWNVGGWNDFTAERTHYSAGDGESYGLELTANYAFTNVWTVGGYIALMKASYTDSCSISVPNYRDAPGGARGVGNFLEPILTPANDGVEVSCGKVDGNDIPRQSPVSANLNISATLPNEILGLRTSFRADVRHRGPYYEDPLNALERNAVTTLNLSANMRNENWRLRFYIDNVTDEDEPTRISLGNFRTTPANPALPPANNGAWLMNPRRPREYGLQLEYAF